MISRVRTVQWALATVVVLAAAAVAFAQQTAAQRQQTQQPGNAQQGQQRVTVNRLPTETGAAQNSDHTIANWLAIQNEAEIEIAKAAAAKTDNKDVRDFAEKLVKEHTEMQQHLQRFGAQPVRLAAESRKESPTARTGAVQEQGKQQGQPLAQGQVRAQNQGQQNQRQRPVQGQPAQGQVAGARQGGFNFLEVQREIAELCVANAEKGLDETKGSHRDEAFVGMQIAAHQMMIDTELVLRNYASPELRGVIDQGREAAESHLDHAKKLIYSLVRDEKRDSDKDRNDKDRNQ